jgi:hypothetical protein
MRGLNGQREQFERRADELRDRLLHTIEAIDQRRQNLFDVRYQVRRHGSGVAAAGVVIAIAASAAVAVMVRSARSRDARMRRERVQALVRSWRHPDWVAARGKPSVPREIGRRILVGAATYAAMELIRRGIRLTLSSSPRLSPARRRVLELRP